MPTPSNSYVGRARELAAVDDLLVSPYGSVLVVEGEPGIGKTALLDIACARATARDVRVARASADDAVLETPLGLLHRALESLSPDGSPLTITWPPEAPAVDPSAALERVALPSPVVDQLVDALERAGEDGPVLVVLDDLQWADESTIMVLASLARRSRDLGTSYLLALRPTPRSTSLARTLAAMERDGATITAMPPLTDGEVDELLSSRDRDPLTDREVGLVRAAGGNPYFILEVLAALDRGDDADDASATAGELPAQLRNMLVRRVESEGEEVATMLRVAAVVGRRVAMPELLVLLRTTAVELAPSVATAVRNGWWTDEGGEIAFRHDLVREALVEDTSAALRTQMHRDVAAALIETRSSPERVAHHLAQSIDPPDPATVAQVLELLRDLPRTMSRPILAELRERLPADDPDRPAVEVAYCHSLVWSNDPARGEELAREALTWISDPALVYDLLASRSYALFQLGRPREAIDSWEDARARAKAEITPFEHAQMSVAKLFAGDIDGANQSASIAIDDPATPGHAVRIARFTRAWTASARGDLATALEETGIALEDALANPEPGRLPHDVPQLYRATMVDGAGRGEEALELLGRDHPGTADLGSAAVGVLRHATTSMVLFRLGRWDEARAEAEAGSALSVDTGVGLGVGWVTGTQALIALHSGDPDRCAAILSEQPTGLLGPTLGFDWLAYAKTSLDQVRGNGEQALGTLLVAIEMAMAAGAAMSVTYLGIEAARLTNDPGGTLARLLDAIDPVPDDVALAAAVAARRHLHAIIDGDADELVEVASIIAAMPRPWEAGRCYQDAAVVAARAGDAARARAHAKSAFDRFEEVGAWGSIAQLRADLRAEGVQLRLASRPAEPADVWDQLTPTQRVVVALVGEGLSNSQIAERLFVSRRTVESHLARVYQRLDIPSRVALVQAVAARGDAAGR